MHASGDYDRKPPLYALQKLQQVSTMEFLEELKRLGIANELIIEAWKNFSGNGIYICKFKEISTAERNRRIKAEFTGDNRRELSIKYNLSYSRVCRILNDGQIKKVVRTSNDRRQIITRKAFA